VVVFPLLESFIRMERSGRKTHVLLAHVLLVPRSARHTCASYDVIIRIISLMSAALCVMVRLVCRGEVTGDNVSIDRPRDREVGKK
jgi:hypothetical protein